MSTKTIPDKEKVVNKTTEMHIDNEGILRIAVLEDAEIDIEEAKENFDSAVKLSGGKSMLKLVDARAFFTMTKKARDFAASRETNEHNIARAVIVHSLANRLLVNFFIRFHKPKSPLRMFSSEAEALKWLRKFSD
jgi:hypothetical protein